MKSKTTKIIAIIIVAAMILTSLSFVFILPTFMGMEGYVAYGATTQNAKIASSDRKYITERLGTLEQYIEYLYENYKDEVAIKTLIDGAFEGTTDALDDPFSVYYASEEEAELFVTEVNGEFVGVGVTIRSVDDKCRVEAVSVGSPAQEAGILEGDVITMVDGKTVVGMDVSEIAQKLRGEKDTQVSVTIDRNGIAKTFTITRATIKSNCVSYEMKDNNIGYIYLNGFDDDAATEFQHARVALINKGAKGIILDLRDNPGGIIGTSIDIADQILKSGDIVHLENRGNLIESYSANDTVSMDLPMAVLVNENSASATEILAGALQDNGIPIVGTTTYGKGEGQVVAKLNDGSSVKVSTFYFITPDKHTIQHVGITPNYVVRNALGEVSTELLAQYKTFAPMTEAEKPVLGTTGLNVYGAQQRLALLGHYSGPITGTMDTATLNAMKEFQKLQGLFVYGVMDYSTMNALDEAAYAYVTNASTEDLQYNKALELVTK